LYVSSAHRSPLCMSTDRLLLLGDLSSAQPGKGPAGACLPALDLALAAVRLVPVDHRPGRARCRPLGLISGHRRRHGSDRQRRSLKRDWCRRRALRVDGRPPALACLSAKGRRRGRRGRRRGCDRWRRRARAVEGLVRSCHPPARRRLCRPCQPHPDIL
jgi:hypothetical protein